MSNYETEKRSIRKVNLYGFTKMLSALVSDKAMCGIWRYMVCSSGWGL